MVRTPLQNTDWGANVKINREIKALDKVEKPIVAFSERYCKNVDLRQLIKNLPLIGGSLDSLLAYKGSKIIQERMDLFFEQTTEALNRLGKDKIDKDFFESEEGFYVFQKICEQVIRTKEKEKVIYFRNIFINSTKAGKSKVYYKERFINIVADLSVLHMEILEYYLQREEAFKKENRKGADAFTSLHSVSQRFEITKSQAEAFCNDLLRYSLLYDDAIGKYGYKRGKFRIADNAIDFVNFILLKN